MFARSLSFFVCIWVAFSGFDAQTMNKKQLELKYKLLARQQSNKDEINKSSESKELKEVSYTNRQVKRNVKLIADDASNARVCALDLRVSTRYLVDLVKHYTQHENCCDTQARIQFGIANVIFCSQLLQQIVMKKESHNKEKFNDVFIEPLKDVKTEELQKLSDAFQEQGECAPKNIGALFYRALDAMNLASNFLGEKGDNSLASFLNEFNELDTLVKDGELPRISSIHLSVVSDDELGTLKEVAKIFGIDALKKPLIETVYPIHCAIFFNARETVQYLIAQGCYKNEFADHLISLVGDPLIGDMLLGAVDPSDGLCAKRAAAKAGNLDLVKKITFLEQSIQKKSVNNEAAIKLVREKIKKYKKMSDTYKIQQYGTILTLLDESNTVQPVKQKSQEQKIKVEAILVEPVQSMVLLKKKQSSNDQLKVYEKELSKSVHKFVTDVVEQAKQELTDELQKTTDLQRKAAKQERRQAKRLQHQKAESLLIVYSKMQKKSLAQGFCAWKNFIAKTKETESLVLQAQANTKKILVPKYDPDTVRFSQELEYDQSVQVLHGLKPDMGAHEWYINHVNDMRQIMKTYKEKQSDIKYGEEKQPADKFQFGLILNEHTLNHKTGPRIYAFNGADPKLYQEYCMARDALFAKIARDIELNKTKATTTP